MSDINNVILIGNLVRDVELRYTNTGTAMSKMAIAVSEKRKTQDGLKEETSFIDITLWGKAAESLSQYLKKGKKIAVIGKLKQSRWEQDGQNRSKLEVFANNIQLLGGKSDNQQNNQQAQNNSQPQRFEDDIPF